jgi:hypothetical protein
VTDEDLLLLLRGGWLPGEGDLANPTYRAALQEGAVIGAKIDRALLEGEE